MEGAPTNQWRETYFSDTYKNILYEKEHAKEKNIREFIPTYTQDDATYHDFGTKKDAGVCERRAVDHRDLIGASHRIGSISGNVKKVNEDCDTFHNESVPTDTIKGHRQRKHYDQTKTTQDIVGSNVLHQVDYKESKEIHNGWKVPVKEERVTNYMGSSSMKDCMTLPTKVGEIEPKATIHGFGVSKPKDVWAPKAYRSHANAGNQRFYID